LAVINWSGRTREIILDMDKNPGIKSFTGCGDQWNGIKINDGKLKIPAMDVAWFI